MKENENIRIKCSKVILVPYEACHVQKYHRWMESEALREQTASERLTIDEEFEMQKKWRLDEDKCTFIILDKEIYERSQGNADSNKEIEAMVGDVNIFYSSGTRSEGEVEIMIAESSARGKGFGKEALCCMMRYAHETLKTSTFVSKIGFENIVSFKLFQSLGFQEVSRSEIFKEVTLTLEVPPNQNTFEKLAPYYFFDVIK